MSMLDSDPVSFDGIEQKIPCGHTLRHQMLELICSNVLDCSRWWKNRKTEYNTRPSSLTISRLKIGISSLVEFQAVKLGLFRASERCAKCRKSRKGWFISYPLLMPLLIYSVQIDLRQNQGNEMQLNQHSHSQNNAEDEFEDDSENQSDNGLPDRGSRLGQYSVSLIFCSEKLIYKFA